MTGGGRDLARAILAGDQKAGAEFARLYGRLVEKAATGPLHGDARNEYPYALFEREVARLAAEDVLAGDESEIGDPFPGRLAALHLADLYLARAAGSGGGGARRAIGDSGTDSETLRAYDGRSPLSLYLALARDEEGPSGPACPGPAALASHASGKTTSAGDERFAAHVDACPRCGAAIRRARERRGTSSVARPVATPPAAFEASEARRRRTIALAVAALALLALLLFFLARADSFVGSGIGDERDVAGIPLVWCPAGRFVMGSPPGEPERRPGEDQVEVTLTRGFWMGKTEVTQGQWSRVVGEFPGELSAGEGDDFPVTSVSFADAEAFCREATELAHGSRELPEDWELRLPTEAQWEYACRAGTTTATSFGDALDSRQANFQGRPYNGAEEGPSLKRAAPVASYPPNAWGLHDVHGNVFEWCRDWYHARLPGGRDPDLHAARSSAAVSEHGGVSRVRRGGCWADEGWPCRSAFRLRFEPDRRSDHIGFRVAAVRP